MLLNLITKYMIVFLVSKKISSKFSIIIPHKKKNQNGLKGYQKTGMRLPLERS